VKILSNEASLRKDRKQARFELKWAKFEPRRTRLSRYDLKTGVVDVDLSKDGHIQQGVKVKERHYEGSIHKH
jgi:hypothetical protein